MQSHDFVLVETVWLILLITGITALITQGPSNTVAEIGMQVNLTCIANAKIGKWFLSKDGTDTDKLTIVGSGCSTVNDPFDDHYIVESLDEGKTCNLIVFNITMEQAGVYKCQQIQNEPISTAASILTVIDSPPGFTVNSTTDVVESENVTIACNLNHNGSVASAPTLRPYFYWTYRNGHNVSSSYDSTTEDTAVSQLTVTAKRHNITSYTCHVYLQLIPSTNPIYAKNTPPVNSSAISPTIEVFYSPIINHWSGHTEVIEIDGTTCVVGVITFYATGNPPPSYEWFDSKDNVSISNERTLDLAEINRNYTCVAYNTIRNEVHRDSRSYIAMNVSIIQDCRFPRSESTWISTKPVEDCDNGTCACSSGNDGFTLTCNAVSYPSALYQWIGADESVIDSEVYENAHINGTYRCTAYFNQSSSNYTGNAIFSNGSSEMHVNIIECFSPPDEPEDSEVVLITCIAIGAYILGNIIATAVFLIYYNRNIGFKQKLNDRFAWLKKLLPSMNDDVECKFGWIFLSICVFALVGILFTICMVVIANCSRGRSPKRSEDSAPHFHNPSDIRHPRENQETGIQHSTLGSSYEDIEEETRLASQDKNRENKDQKIRQNAKENWKPTTIQSPLNADNRTAVPPLPPPKPHNEVPQHQKPSISYGPVYSELLVTNHNIQPVQYIEGNAYNTNYSELKTT